MFAGIHFWEGGATSSKEQEEKFYTNNVKNKRITINVMCNQKRGEEKINLPMDKC